MHFVHAIRKCRTIRAARGINTKLAKIVAGADGAHSIAVTLDTYSHVLPGMQEAVAKRFEEDLHATRKGRQEDYDLQTVDEKQLL